MKLSSWSVRHPLPVCLLFVLLSLLGIRAFQNMRVETWPMVHLPTVTVVAVAPGVGPTSLESDMARRLEEAVAPLQQVKHVFTRITEGVVVTTITFELEKSAPLALQEVRTAVAAARSTLPAEMRDPLVTLEEAAPQSILKYAIASTTQDDLALSSWVDEQLTTALRALPGVGAVVRVGGANRELRVALIAEELQARQLTAADVGRQLRQLLQAGAAGRATTGQSGQAVRTAPPAAGAEALAALQLPLPEGRQVRLGQIARVQDTSAPPQQGAWLNGRRVVGVEVMRTLNSDELATGQAVRAYFAELARSRPDLQITEAASQLETVEDNYRSALWLLVEAALLAVLVVAWFLRGWRATLVVALALPLSVLPALAVMHYGLGLTLNLVTMLALTLVMGILVDDAIVEIENITQHLAMGKTPMQAACDAADEIGLAVVATSMALVAVFLPTVFLAGVTGRYFVQFGYTAAIAVFFSLLVARMVTPLMAAYCLQRLPRHRPATASPAWVARTARATRWCLRHRALSWLVVLAVFAGSAALWPWLGTGFMPADDASQTQVRLTLPAGLGWRQAEALSDQARQLAQGTAHVRSVYTTLNLEGGAVDPLLADTGMDAGTATLTLRLTPRAMRPGVSKQAIEASLRQALQQLAGVRVQVGFADDGERFTLALTGDDGAALQRHARQVAQALRAMPGLGQVTVGGGLVRSDLVVRLDAARAADLGVTSAAATETLRVALAGSPDLGGLTLPVGHRQVPVVLRLAPSDRDDPQAMLQLQVAGARGPVALSSVASVRAEASPAQIERMDRKRYVGIEVELGERSLGEVSRAAMALPALKHPPAGIRIAEEGDAQSMTELFQSFSTAMLTGVACIFLTLVLLFRHLLQPLTILAALLLAVPGAFWVLFLTNTPLAMPTLIGLLMLMGIAAKNSILLVDHALSAQRTQQVSSGRAMLEACRKRARPIVMTSAAMAAGMAPIALGLGTDPGFRGPMAVVVLGGLLTSTVLSLLVIPLLYVALGGQGKSAGQPQQTADSRPGPA